MWANIHGHLAFAESEQSKLIDVLSLCFHAFFPVRGIFILMRIYDQKLLDVTVNGKLQTVSINELLQPSVDGYTPTLSESASDELKRLMWLTTQIFTKAIGLSNRHGLFRFQSFRRSLSRLSQPAIESRMKTSHFEERIGLSGVQTAQRRDERTQRDGQSHTTCLFVHVRCSD